MKFRAFVDLNEDSDFGSDYRYEQKQAKMKNGSVERETDSYKKKLKGKPRSRAAVREMKHGDY